MLKYIENNYELLQLQDGTAAGAENKVSQSSVIDVPSPEVNEEVKPERPNVEPVDPSSIE